MLPMPVPADAPTQVAYDVDLTLALTAPHLLAWVTIRPGVELHELHEHGEGGPAAALLRFAPGAEMPEHTHPGYEHALVLEGVAHDERGAHGPGTFVVTPPAEPHRVSSPGGCLVLVVWERSIRFEP